MWIAVNPFAASSAATKSPGGRKRMRRNRALGALGARLRLWAERNRDRRELAAMSSRDFGDLAVPESLVRDEVRRWPWQKPSAGWRAVGAAQQAGVPAIHTGLPLPGLELAQSPLASMRRRGREV